MVAKNDSKVHAPIVAQIRALHDRLLRAEILASAGKVHSVVDMPDAYIVEETKGPYLIKDGKCPCPDAAKWCAMRINTVSVSVRYSKQMGDGNYKTVELGHDQHTHSAT
jgi:hypothetical protein